MLLRRVLSFAVAAFVVPLLMLQLALVFACGTVLQPDYLANRLEKASAYDFLLDRLLPTALDDARDAESPLADGSLYGNPLVLLGVSNRDVVAWTVKVAPQEWFDETLRTSATEVWEYVTGRSDEFAVSLRIPTDEAVLASETLTLLKRSDLYDYAIESHLAPAAEDLLASDVLPFGAGVNSMRVESAVRQVVTKAWFDARVTDAVSSFTPYATGRESGFDLRVDLAELGPVATAEYKRVLFDTGAYNSLYDSVVEPAVWAVHGERIDLALGVALYSEDVVLAIQDAGQGRWVRGEVDKAVDETTGYLFGNTDGFAFLVSLDPIADEVTSRLEEVAHGRILALATVTGESAADAQARRAVVGRTDAILASVGPMVVELLSSEVRFTERDLRDALSREDNERLDDLRLVMRDGFTYTEEDLRDDIWQRFDDPKSVEEAIETVRELFSDGWTYTYFDLLGDLSADSDTSSGIEPLRYTLSRLRIAAWVVSVLAAAGLAAVWLLAGGARHIRAAWVSAALAAGFLATLLIFLVGNFVADAAIEAARAAAVSDIDRRGDFADTLAVAVPWVFNVLQSGVGGYTSGVALASAALAALSLAALAASLRWPKIEPLVRRYAWPRRG